MDRRGAVRGARAFWDPQYPLRSTARNLAAVQVAGYRVSGVHHQPDSDWAEYYGPLGERVRACDDPTAGAPARAATAAVREELDVRERHGHEYGYTGYVLRPVTAGDGGAWPARPETAADVPGVREVNLAAFETPWRRIWSTPSARTSPGCRGCRTWPSARTDRRRRTPC